MRDPDTTVLLSWGLKPKAMDLSGWHVRMAEPLTAVESVSEPREALLDALDAPDGLPRFDEWIRGAGSVAVVVPDLDRPMPWPEMPGFVVRRVLSAGIDPDAVCVVVATGLDRFSGWRSHPLDGLREIEGVRVDVHDAMDRRSSRPVGRLGRGEVERIARGIIGEVSRLVGGQVPSASRARASSSAGAERTLRLDRTVAGAERIILVAPVWADGLAGITGGSPLVLPGVADGVSILANEEHALLPGCGPGVTVDNPAREEMDAASRVMEDRVMAIEVTGGPHGGVVGFAVGSPWLTTSISSRLVAESVGVRENPASCVLASAPSRTIEGLVRAGTIVAPLVSTGGVLILAGQCPGGVEDAGRARRLVDLFLGPRLPGVQVIVLTDVPAPHVLRAGLRPVRSVGACLEVARDWVGGESEVLVVTDATRILPLR